MLTHYLRWYNLLWIPLLFATELWSQNGSYAHHITGADGLSQGAVFDILQDSEGFLWFGTKDGLNRYDGYNFKVYTNDPDDPWSISGNTVTRLFEDSHGRIWAATDNTGIDIYDKKTGRFHHIQYDPLNPAGLSGTHIATIVEDTSRYFLLNVDEKEINMFTLEDDFFKNQQSPQVIRIQMPGTIGGGKAQTSLLKGIAKDAKGRIWVGGQDAIYQLDVPKAKLNLATQGFSIGATQNNPDGSIWAAGHFTPLFHWNGKKAIRIPGQFNAIKYLRGDDRNNVWAMRADSVFGLDLKERPNNAPGASFREHIFFEWAPQIENEDFPLLSIEIDNSGLIWVGSNGYGLYRINPNQSRFTHKFPGISIRQIAVIAQNEYFLNSYAGWYKEDGTHRQSDPLGVDGTSKTYDKMLKTQSGEYWIRQTLTEKNSSLLKRYNPLTGKTQFLKIPWHHDESQPMMESQDGLIWMAGFNRVLTCIDPSNDRIHSYQLENGNSVLVNDDEKIMSKEYSTTLYEDSQGVLWVGTENGIIKCERTSDLETNLQVYHIKNIPGDNNSLSYNHVMCFLDDPIDPEKYLWICTKGGGLNRMNKADGSFLRLTKKDGLPDHVIYGILSDQAGNLWGSTNKGIFCMLKSAQEEDLFSFRNFSQKDGLQGEEFNTGAYAKMPDGRLMFGGINGINIFNPQEILSEDFAPPVHITKILVGNQPVNPGDETGILENTIETTDRITLNHEQDILTLEFSSLDYTAPERNRYRYQLIGAEDTWVEAGVQRTATFLHLAPKQYTFRVQGTNSQGIWSDKIAELHINVLPPWWQTWWAYLSYIFLIAGAIWFYFKVSIKRAKLQEQLIFEKREAERVKDLDVLKTQLYMNMTHEFRTPLTIILGMARQVLEQPKENFRSGLNMIIRNGENLLGLVNKMLNLSKLESGKMALELTEGDIILFLKNIVESFRSFAANKEIQLHFLPEVDFLHMVYDKDKIQQVVSNLISNAYKFTPKGGHIYFSIRREIGSDEPTENGILAIRVKDTGRGISEMELESVFDRFYQTDNSTTRQYEGTGIGLALSKELVKLMEGEISVQSPPVGATLGSEFMFTLPVKTTSFEIDEMKTAAPIQANKPVSESKPKLPDSEIKETISIDESDQPLILLVEDNADVVAYVASCLRPSADDENTKSNYRLAVAENGQEGLELAIELIPDLIISDVMMPIMDGFELCAKVKTDTRTDHIPVIILTARADLESKIEGLEIGANAYLPKPYEKQELLLTIKNLLNLRNNLRKRYESLSTNMVVLSTNGIKENDLELRTEDPFVLKVQEIILDHLSDFDFEVGQIAQELHLSHSQLGRKLDALTGYTPNRFIRLLRLQKAKELLAQENMSVTAVSYDCGFNDPSYFSRVFKKEFGQTPGVWKERLVKR